jgi:drug/metabolite transporter (DMT)-like permease
MYWLLLSVLTPVLFAIGDIAEKMQLDKVFRHWLSYFTLAYAAWSVIVAAIFLTSPVSFDATGIMFGLASGLLGTAGSVFYLKALSKEEASRVLPLSYVSIIFTIVLASVFLGEALPALAYVGIGLFVAGAMVLSYRTAAGQAKARFSWSPVIGIIILSALLSSSSDIVSKSFLASSDFWSLMCWNYIGGIPIVIFLLLQKSNRVHIPDIKTFAVDRKALLILGSTVIVYFVAELAWFAAISQSPISIVSAIGTTEPMFVLLFSAAINMLRPKSIADDLSGHTLLAKSLSVILIVAGAVLAAV